MTEIRRIRITFFILFLIIGLMFAQDRKLTDILIFGLLLGPAIGSAMGSSKNSVKEGVIYGLICCLGIWINAGLKFLTVAPVNWWYLWGILTCVGILLTITCRADTLCIFVDVSTKVSGASILIMLLGWNLVPVPLLPLKLIYACWGLILIGSGIFLAVSRLRPKKE